jgi:hypothetical protein
MTAVNSLSFSIQDDNGFAFLSAADHLKPASCGEGEFVNILARARPCR